MKENQTQATSVAKFENVCDQVLNRIAQFQADGSLSLPNNYSVENHLKSAWLILQETKDKDGKPVLSVCTKESIANSLFDMVLQGLAVSKKQGFFVVYGNKLEFQRSYFGSVALAKRAGGLKHEPIANVIYEGDEFVYEIDPNTARVKIVKHKQELENIDNSKIKGAYALVTLADGSTQVTIMSMQQIRAAWGQGATKGNSPAHKNFAEEMAKKTVINRACKMLINSSDDAWIYDDKREYEETDRATKQRDEIVNAERVVLEESEYEEVVSVPKEEEPGY